jgi:ABC-type transport system involved in cytochrome bd biosynthesis fused ATPase/permease subunit
VGTIKFFCLAAVFLGIFVFYFNDKETGLLILVCAPMLLCFSILPFTQEKKPARKTEANNKSDLD